MSTHREALRYVARGWPVLPVWPVVQGEGSAWRCSCAAGAACTEPGKHPRGRRGVLGATLNAAAIDRHWPELAARDGVEPSVAIATGGALVVIDLDAPALGLESWERLCEARGERVETVTVKTPRGRHLYFDASRIGRVGCSVGKLGPGIDVRGERGYVLAPPSRHASGRSYWWEIYDFPGAELAEHTAPLAPLPLWVAELAQRSTRAAAVRVEGGAPLDVGGRNDGLMRLACSLRARGLEEVELRAALDDANATRCTEPLPAREVARIARGVARRYRSGMSPAALLEAARVELSAELSTAQQGRYDFKADPSWYLHEPPVPADPEAVRRG